MNDYYFEAVQIQNDLLSTKWREAPVGLLASEANHLFGHGPERQGTEEDGLVHPVEPPPRRQLLHDNIVGQSRVEQYPR